MRTREVSMTDATTVSALEFMRKLDASDQFITGESGASGIHRGLKKKLIEDLLPLLNETARLNSAQSKHVRHAIYRLSMKGMFSGVMFFRDERILILATYINSCRN